MRCRRLTISYPGSPYCATGTAVVTQTGQAGGTYSSTAGLVINASTGAIDLVASTAGTYTVTYSYTDGVCANSTTSNLTIVALPVASISYPNNPYCTTGAAAVVRTGVSGGVFSSTTGLSINSNTGTIDLAASSPGTYTVTYSFASGACSNTSTTSILVRNPALLLTNPPAACAPSTVDLTAPAVTAGSDAGLSYTYFTDPGGTNPLNQPDAVGTSSTYYIRGTNTATGCTSSLEPVLVRINTPPIVTLAGDTDVCKGSPDTLTANSPGSTIDWLMVGSGGTVVVYPMVSGAYYAVATNAVNCSDTAAITIGVRPFSVALTATPEPVVSGNTVTLSSSANFSYQVIAWEPAATFPDQTAYSQTFTVHDTATQFYVIAQSSQGCLDTAGYSVIVDPNLKDFFIPNAFTPNNDGKNEVFKVYGSSIREVEIRIYSQWGQLVFESHDPQGSWDGSMGGHPVPVGIYLYAIKVVFYNDHILSKKGTVSLIR
jgi:gliding motility-associated-like protein